MRGAAQVLNRRDVRTIALHAGGHAAAEVSSHFLAFEGVVRSYGRVEESSLRRDQFLSLAQCRLRIENGGVVLESLLDQDIQLRRLKQSPPLPADIGRREMLHIAAGSAG